MSTASVQSTSRPARRVGRSIAAVFLGFLAVVVLSLGTDQLLHVVHFYPPWGEPMWDPVQNLVALLYRCVYTVIGGYITSRVAPHTPMRHVWILGLIGLVMGTLGAAGTWNLNLGPHWYPVAIAVTGLPLTLLGGRLDRRRTKAG